MHPRKTPNPKHFLKKKKKKNLGKCLGFDKILGCIGCISILKTGRGGFFDFS